ncbi:MAG: bifunctional ADP-dependent NAD(P)H-hydrate dehydratase/NAD(P)H-hydrate epimerase, partial [Candidatus Thioglobus sp. MED-G23]
MNVSQHLLCKTDQIRLLEEAMIASGRSAEALMEAAGRAAFRALRQRWPRAHVITVYCGKGNNGGDGYVLARIAKNAGLWVRMVSLGE